MKVSLTFAELEQLLRSHLGQLAYASGCSMENARLAAAQATIEWSFVAPVDRRGEQMVVTSDMPIPPKVVRTPVTAGAAGAAAVPGPAVIVETRGAEKP